MSYVLARQVFHVGLPHRIGNKKAIRHAMKQLIAGLERVDVLICMIMSINPLLDYRNL
jgi:hypothetical protein